MKPSEFHELAAGDLICRTRGDDQRRYVVAEKSHTHIVAVHVVKVNNPCEWEFVTEPGHSESVPSLNALRLGTMIRRRLSGNCYIVTSVHQDFCSAVHTIALTKHELRNWKFVLQVPF